MANLGILLVEAGLGGQQKGVLGGERVHGIVGGFAHCLAQSKACNSEKLVSCGLWVSAVSRSSKFQFLVVIMLVFPMLRKVCRSPN